MDVFALGDLLLGSAYVLQLVEGEPAWSVMSVVNHTLTLAAPIAYWLGAMRFFGQPVPVWRPLIAFSVAYGMAQWLVHWSAGPVARYAMLAAMSAVLFFAMTLNVIYGLRTFAKDFYGEMIFFAFCDWRHLCAQCIEILENYGQRPGSSAHGKPLSDGFLHLHVHPGDRAASLHCLAGVAAPDG